MRHSDRRLTDQVYLDTSLRPLQDCIRTWVVDTDMDTHFRENLSFGVAVGETVEGGENAGSTLSVGSGR